LHVPIKNKHNGDDTARWDDITPEMDDNVACNDLEGYECRFEDEKVVACSETECLVDPATSETNKRRRDGKVGDHLSHA
jgi:hypothetical protein